MVLPIISVAVVATLAVAAEPPAASEGTLYAASPRYQAPTTNRSKPQFVSSSNITPIRDLRAEGAVSGSEPDPETFDKLGLERWWSKHRKAAK
jgi:hypothetical protein